MIKYILSDIEGTTTEISFISQVLFPYFLEHLSTLKSQTDNPLINQAVQDIQATVLSEEHVNISRDQAFERLVFWTRTDRKHPTLKLLQGLVWKEGYLSSQLKAHLYEDVAVWLNIWYDKKTQLGIYSSGSVQAQQLLFTHSVSGDLSPLFSHYFDTSVGHKREELAYKNILQAIEQQADEVLFLSDVPEELDAAKANGMHTIQLIRPGTVASGRHLDAKDFEEVNTLIQEINGF